MTISHLRPQMVIIYHCVSQGMDSDDWVCQQAQRGMFQHETEIVLSAHAKCEKCFCGKQELNEVNKCLFRSFRENRRETRQWYQSKQLFHSNRQIGWCLWWTRWLIRTQLFASNLFCWSPATISVHSTEEELLRFNRSDIFVGGYQKHFISVFIFIYLFDK